MDYIHQIATALYDSLEFAPISFPSILLCSMYAYAVDGHDKYKKKHLIESVQPFIQEGIDISELDRHQLNAILRQTLDFVPSESTVAPKYPLTGYGHEKTFTLILTDNATFMAAFNTLDPRINDTYQHLTPGFECLEHSRLPNNISFVPLRCSILCFYYIEKTRDYDVYIRKNMFPLVGHGPNSSKLVPVCYSGAILSTDDEKTLHNLLTSVPHPYLQARFTRAEEIEKYFTSAHVVKRPDQIEIERDTYQFIPERFNNQQTLLYSNKDVFEIDESLELAIIQHSFKYLHTMDTLDISIQGSVFDRLVDLTFSELGALSCKILGRVDYGKTVYLHVVMASLDDIRKDLMAAPNENRVSEKHTHWRWLSCPKTVLSIVQDFELDGYRFVIKKDTWILLECVPDKDGNLTIPFKVKHVSHHRFPYNVEMDHPYIETILEDPTMLQEEWKQFKFIH